MTECEYGKNEKIEYFNHQTNIPERYYCHREAISNNKCMFHDIDYAKNHSNDIVKSINLLVEGAMQNDIQLLLIGFKISGQIKLDNYEFNNNVYFNYSQFYEVADFDQTTFNKKVEFPEVIFLKKANFHKTKFKMNANFRAVKFNGEADFQDANFYEKAYAKFSEAKFNGEVDFHNANFNEKANFSQASFNNKKSKTNFSSVKFKEVDFSNANFNTITYFHDVNFGTNCTNCKEKAFFSEVTFNEEADFDMANFYGEVNFNKTEFNEVNFTDSTFTKKVNFTDSKFTKKASFSRSTFNEADFNKTEFNEVNFTDSTFTKKVNFTDSKFTKKASFSGVHDKPIQMRDVSFKGVDLSNVEFHNVKWQKKRELFFNRYLIIDEEELKGKEISEDVIKIYNQLRKNFEARSQYAEAASFYIGEMETRRIMLSKSHHKKERLTSFIYLIAKWMTFYGESASLPLFLWSPILIILFGLIRNSYGICSGDSPCDIQSQMIDSLAAFLQFPRSQSIPSDIDIIERVISLPLFGIALRSIVTKKRFDIFIRNT